VADSLELTTPLILTRMLELEELLDIQANQPLGFGESLSTGLPQAKLFEMVVLVLSLPVYVAEDAGTASE